MTGHFEPQPGGGAAVPLDEVEISILRSLAVQLMELLGPGEEAGESESDDLLASIFNDGPSEPPADPVLARLFPDAYGGPTSSPTTMCAPPPPSSAATPRTICAPASARTPWR